MKKHLNNPVLKRAFFLFIGLGMLRSLFIKYGFAEFGQIIRQV
jgi:hypothetical protein